MCPGPDDDDDVQQAKLEEKEFHNYEEVCAGGCVPHSRGQSEPRVPTGRPDGRHEHYQKASLRTGRKGSTMNRPDDDLNLL